MFWCLISGASSCFCTSAEAYECLRKTRTYHPGQWNLKIGRALSLFVSTRFNHTVSMPSQQTIPEHSFIFPTAEQPRSRKYIINVLHPKAQLNQGPLTAQTTKIQIWGH